MKTNLADHIPLVYIIGPDEHGPVKIGLTSRLAIRAVELQVANYECLRIFGVRFAAGSPSVNRFSVKDCFRIGAEQIERKAHDKLKELDCHIRGEWFDVSARDALAVIDKVSKTDGPKAIGLEGLLGVDLSGRADRKMDKALAVMTHEAVAINQFIHAYNDGLVPVKKGVECDCDE